MGLTFGPLSNIFMAFSQIGIEWAGNRAERRPVLSLAPAAKGNFMLLIIDFGSQFNQLIARRVRELRVYCQIEPPDIPIERIRELNPEGIILSGGPASIYADKSPRIDPAIFALGVPVLGICYGMQFMVDALGGRVEAAQKREYGFAALQIERTEGPLADIASPNRCWMSHGDHISRLPEGFETLAITENSPFAAVQDATRRLYGLQRGSFP